MDSRFLQPDILFAGLPAEPRVGPEFLQLRRSVVQAVPDGGTTVTAETARCL